MIIKFNAGNPGTLGSVEGLMTFKDAQEYVGGYVKTIYPPDGACLLVNKEGRILGLPLNNFASTLYRRPLFGNVLRLTDESVNLVLGNPDEEE